MIRYIITSMRCAKKGMKTMFYMSCLKNGMMLVTYIPFLKKTKRDYITTFMSEQ